MKPRNKKKAFTIVELVVVIAVIAVLAAVLIPTFSHIVKKAQKSSDTQLIRNLNTALLVDGEEHPTMHDALKATKDAGYDVAKINTTETENEILWDSKNDVFCYLENGNVKYIPDSVAAGDKIQANEHYKLWRIARATEDLTCEYSCYLGYDASGATISTNKGIDVGENAGVTSITYNKAATAQDVVIRTNGGALTIDADTDDVQRYGFADELNIIAVRPDHCYHEHGFVSDFRSFGTGKFVAEAGAGFHQSQAEIQAVLDGKTADVAKAQFNQHFYGENDRCVECDSLRPGHVHTWNFTIEEDPEDANKNIFKFECTVCGETYTQSIDKPSEPHEHNLQHVEAKAPTCIEIGNKEYWVCSCGKFFADAAGANEIPATSVILSATGVHTWSDWTHNETTHTRTCTNPVCTATESERHDWVEGEVQAATCVDNGSKEYNCLKCGRNKTEVIPATGHTYGPDHKCTVCGENDPDLASMEGKLTNNTTLNSYAFQYNETIKYAVIPDGVTTIGRNAFDGCTNLEEVTLPDSVTTINSSAFQGCTALKEITLPDGVTTINSNTFKDCTALKEVTLPASVTTISTYAFQGCKELTEVTIPASVTTISKYAFQGCKELTDVTLPAAVTTIADYTFDGCKKLTNVTLHDSITAIQTNAFANSGLTSVEIPASVTSVASTAFISCSDLTTITVAEGNTTYTVQNNCLIKGAELVLGCKNSTIPTDGSVTSIGANAFDGCSGLTSVTIPDTVTSIGNYAFRNCTALTSITIPDSVTKIGTSTTGSVFFGCTSLESVTLSAQITTIQNATFSGCIKLKSITIPSGVTQIGQSAFQDCKALTSINIPNQVTKIGVSAFKNSGLTSITIPSSVKTISMQAFSGCGLTSATFDTKTGWTANGANLNTYLSDPAQTAKCLCGGWTEEEAAKNYDNYPWTHA